LRAVLSGAGLMANTNAPLAAGRSTYYLRKSFAFNGRPSEVQLKLNPLVADGAIFYLNGLEVYRQNLPDGPIAYSTPALAAVATPTFTGPVPISSGNLVNGTNVLGVEVHMASGSTGLPLNGADLFF